MPTKAELRARFAARRAQMPATDRAHAASALITHLASSPFRLGPSVTIAAYVPIGAEPGSVEFVDALHERGCAVLLPAVPAGDPRPLEWVHYRLADTGPADALERGRFGLLEPRGPRLGADAVDDAAVIFVPALAVAHTGIRLGRGAGYYDRTIGGSRAELVGVVYDDELVDDLPADAYDVPMGWALTPGGGFEKLG
ncbi:5-formyltetrahydrofolate cyclo-ligase [Gordonia sp. DT30]|uniref:5-formyltetrahydrofolate cyclo-ligase n=1 Tax=unclassified Gordonia (in: high G+C Gram-positive bacteria) TaxID=2657482 RepID=UPI003CF7E11C